MTRCGFSWGPVGEWNQEGCLPEWQEEGGYPDSGDRSTWEGVQGTFTLSARSSPGSRRKAPSTKSAFRFVSSQHCQRAGADEMNESIRVKVPSPSSSLITIKTLVAMGDDVSAM